MKSAKCNIADAALIVQDRSRAHGLRHFDQSFLILTDWTVDRLKRVIDHEICGTRDISQPGDKRHILFRNPVESEGLLALRVRLRCFERLEARQSQ